MPVRQHGGLRVLMAGLALVLATVACQPASPAPPTPAATPVATSTSVVVSTATAAAAAPSPTPVASPTPPPSARPTATTSAAVPVGTSRIDLLNSANAAFERGDVAAAAELYERVTNTPPAPGEPSTASAAIDGLARFRAMVALLSAGREDDARAQLDALTERDPNAPFARLATQLWDQFGMTAQVRAACAQLRPQIASQAGQVLSTLQDLGVRVSADTLCSVPRSAGGY